MLFGAYKGVNWFFGDEREVKNLSQEFLDLRKEGETKAWFDDHADLAFEGNWDYFNLNNGGYEGMNKHFDAFALEAGEVTKSNDLARFVLTEYQVDDYEDYYLVSVDDNNGKVKGLLFFGVNDGDPKLLLAGVLTATATMGKDGGDGEESPVAAETVASENTSESPATTTKRKKPRPVKRSQPRRSREAVDLPAQNIG